MCDARNQLNACISEEAKESCLNEKVFAEIQFEKKQNAEKNGRNAITNFRQLEYICSEGGVNGKFSLIDVDFLHHSWWLETNNAKKEDI